MSPSTCCFSLVTSSTTSPDRTVTLVHLGSWRVADTTYLGRLFSRCANSPGLAVQRAPNHSSLRRPSSRAAVPSTSAYSTLPHSSRSLPPYWTNQPPRPKPSSPSGSWTTPSSETFVVMTIFPMVSSPSCPAGRIVRAVGDGYTAARGNWASGNRPVCAPGGVHTPMETRPRPGGEEGDACGGDGTGPDRPGAGRGWRRVPRADRAVPPGAAGALLPDARILPGRRGRPAGNAAGRVAGSRRVHRRARLAAHLAVQDRHQPVPQRDARGPAPPGEGVGCARR